MSRSRNFPGWAMLAVGSLLLATAAVACEEDSKTAPEKCGTPPLLIYDVQGDAQGEGGANPCVTKVGHAVSPATDVTPPESGGSAGKGGSGGSAGKGGGGTGGTVGTSGDAAGGAGNGGA